MTTVVTSAVVNGDGWARLSSGPGFLAAVESPRDLTDNALSQPLLVLACLRFHATRVFQGPKVFCAICKQSMPLSLVARRRAWVRRNVCGRMHPHVVNVAPYNMQQIIRQHGY
jgi:hypothetical protein